MITYVRDIETGRIVPGAVALRSEPVCAVPRRVRMAVKVDYDFVRVMHHDAGHGPWQNSATPIHDDNPRESCREGSKLAQYGRPASNRTGDAPCNHENKDSEEDGDVLVKRQQRQRVEYRTDRCKHRVRSRVHQRRVGYRNTRFCIKDRRGADEGCSEDRDSGNGQRR